MLTRHALSRARLAPLGLAAFAFCAMTIATPLAAAAQEQFSGEWVIARAVAAPWASDPKDRSDEAESQRLLGKRMTIGKGVFRAPPPLGCAKPTFAYHDVKADGLFEGSLNADGAGKATDPVAAARALGFAEPSAHAMTASCSEVEFVLIDPDTMLFGLNNRVFTAKRGK
jgi:hypothetical protein